MNNFNKKIQSCNNYELCSFDVNKYNIKKGTGKLLCRMFTNKPLILFIGMNPSKNRYQYAIEAMGNELNGNIKRSWHSESKTGNQLCDVIYNLGIINYCAITNVVKCSTHNNKVTFKDLNNCFCLLEKEIKILKPKYIIALVNKISNFLFIKNIEHFKIHHPSYCFSYKRITTNEYKNEIFDIIRKL